MWMLSFLPGSFLLLVIQSMLVIGAVGTFISFFLLNRLLRWFPALAVAHTLIQLVSVAFLVAGLYFYGSYSTEMEWRKRVEEMEAKVAAAEAKSKETNTKIVTKVVTKTQIIRTRGETITKYIDKEVVKYDTKFAPGGECEIPKEFIKAHNDAAEVPK
jgi:hypothetical protein